jgi:S-adenosylmethionine:tRNA ribosyltransferase-isomerase
MIDDVKQVLERGNLLEGGVAMPPPSDRYDFVLPAQLEASEPPEARGLERDEVRLMVSYAGSNRIEHTIFRDLPRFLDPGDVVVINTSRTINAALPAVTEDGLHLELHLSTHLPDGNWMVELRRITEESTVPMHGDLAGQSLHLPGGGRVTILRSYSSIGSTGQPQQSEPNLSETGKHSGASNRLWITTVELPHTVYSYLDRYGFPIRYHYVKQQWPLKFYQTVYATEPGSAEMPSAGRGFTTEMITQLVAKGIQVVPLVLHTGVSSLETHEPPYEEFYKVPLETAGSINHARVRGKRIIAVGTTVVRALESVTDDSGSTHSGEGWTKLVIMPDRNVRSVNAILTGLHEPKATHIAMLEAIAGREHISATYAEALKREYLWHEFGDLHLILP